MIHSLIILFICLSFMVCAHDQMIIPRELYNLANPIPIKSNCDKDFKIVIGIIDSGVDYNHPLLIENAKFKLNSDCIPIGFGYDFLSNDQWASPYLVRTDYLNLDISQSGRNLDISILSGFDYFLTIVDESIKNRLNPYRVIESDTFHGTMVAGLATYDEPNIGLIGYRVNFPKSLFTKEHLTWRDAVVTAVNDGARIINLSIDSFPSVLDDRYLMEYFLKEKSEFTELIRGLPNILFVAAMGNKSQKLNFLENVPHYPCGIDLPNVICVGSVNSTDEISEFSNYAVNYNNVVYTLAEGVHSIIPSESCPGLAYSTLESFLSMPNGYFRDSMLSQASNALVIDCKRSTLKANGTSFAAPQVSRRAGQILIKEPNLTPNQVIEKILNEAEVHFSQKAGPIRILRSPPPSWVY